MLVPLIKDVFIKWVSYYIAPFEREVQMYNQFFYNKFYVQPIKV